MKDFRPEPRPVTVALPPNATVNAERTALLPPNTKKPSVALSAIGGRWNFHALPLWPANTQQLLVVRILYMRMPERTNDKVNLGSECELQILLAHKLVQLELFYDTHLCNTLTEIYESRISHVSKLHVLLAPYWCS